MVIYFVKLDNNKQYIFDITCTVILYMYLLPPTTDEHYKDRFHKINVLTRYHVTLHRVHIAGLAGSET